MTMLSADADFYSAMKSMQPLIRIKPNTVRDHFIRKRHVIDLHQINHHEKSSHSF
jgi:hypothetical protein